MLNCQRIWEINPKNKLDLSEREFKESLNEGSKRVERRFAGCDVMTVSLYKQCFKRFSSAACNINEESIQEKIAPRALLDVSMKQT